MDPSRTEMDAAENAPLSPVAGSMSMLNDQDAGRGVLTVDTAQEPQSMSAAPLSPLSVNLSPRDQQQNNSNNTRQAPPSRPPSTRPISRRVLTAAGSGIKGGLRRARSRRRSTDRPPKIAEGPPSSPGTSNQRHQNAHDNAILNASSVDTLRMSHLSHSSTVPSNAMTPPSPDGRSEEEDIVRGVQGVLRNSFLVTLGFLLGAYKPNWVPFVKQLAQCLGVAWATCLAILVLTWYRRQMREQQLQYSPNILENWMTAIRLSQSGVTLSETTPLLPTEPSPTTMNHSRNVSITEDADSPLQAVYEDVEKQEIIRSDAGSIDENVEVEQDEGSVGSIQDKSIFPHPDLEKFFLMAGDTKERIIPNLRPVDVDNELFYGQFFPLIRTPDMDGKGEPGSPANQVAVDYFKGKQRRFDFQWQFKIRKVPTGKVFIAVELPQAPKMGMIQRAFANAALNFVAKMNHGFHYSLTGSDASGKLDEAAIEEGRYEFPHLAFDLEASMDRLVVTKPGETPPVLGTTIHEDPDLIKRRKKGAKIEWNTEDTYTMCLFSAYCDFLTWSGVNFPPPIRPFTFTSLAGPSAVKLGLYQHMNFEKSKHHYRCQLLESVTFEVSVMDKTELGHLAKTWILENKKQSRRNDDIGELVLNKNIVQNDEDDPEEEDVAAAEELGEGMYIKSGDKIVLREAHNEEADDPEINRHGFVTNGGGFVVLQSEGRSIVIIEKAKSQKKAGSSRGLSKLIRSGDTVIFKRVVRESNDGVKEVKYLSIHRGWWLKWVTQMPRHNGYFTIHTHENEAELGSSKRSLSSETQSKYLTLGGSFWLQHRRWSRYEVGISVDDSARYGGKLLGLFKSGTSSITIEADCPDDDEDQRGDTEFEPSEVPMKGKTTWMRPLMLCAHEVNPTRVTVETPPMLGDTATPLMQNYASVSNFIDSDIVGTDSEVIEVDEVKLDVPAWIEMMHRSKRTRQRVYVVRAIQNQVVQGKEESADNLAEKSPSVEEERKFEKTPQTVSFVRLRTGQDLAIILRLGLTWRTGDGGEMPRSTEVGLDYNGDQPMNKNNDMEERLISPGSTTGSLNRHPTSFDFFSDDDAAEFDDDVDLGEHDIEPRSSGTENYEKNLQARRVETLDRSQNSSDKPYSSDMPLSSSDEKTPKIPEATPFSPERLKVKSSGLPSPRRDSFRKRNLLSRKPKKGKRSVSEGDAQIPTSVSTRAVLGNEPSVSHQTVPDNRDYGVATTVRGFSDGRLVQDESLSPFNRGLAPPVMEGGDEFDYGTDTGEEEEDAGVESEEEPCSPRTPDGGSPYKKKSPKTRASKIGRVAKKVKRGTAYTGKQVVKQSKNVGYGTVIAGRAIISKTGVVSHGSRPPGREPRVPIRGAQKKEVRDHHVAVNKAMKSMRKHTTSKEVWSSEEEQHILAGQLSATDQSCRTVSHVLSEMSGNPQFDSLLISQVSAKSELDSCFLRGGAAEIGVVPSKTKGEGLIHGCLVARCLWESHWREEWCGLCDKYLSFYAPLEKKAEFDLPLLDIEAVRKLNVSEDNPLPGHPLLVVETQWRCHYLGFVNATERQKFFEKLNEAIFSLSCGDGINVQSNLSHKGDGDDWKALAWEGYQTAVESSLSSGRSKWATVSSGSKPKQRVVLNGRRQIFDVDPFTDFSFDAEEIMRVAQFVESMLTTALSFSVDSIDNDPKAFLDFIDKTSRLRKLPLHKLDLKQDESFCIFANLYHCLLQHALLLAVDGLPAKRSVGHFMRCMSYEIGGDIFSLAELQCCVLRGNMSTAVSPKPPYIEASKSSKGHRFYALQSTDPLVHFVVNNGDLSHPSAVTVFNPVHLEEQLKTAATNFLKNNFWVDVAKRTCFLPKVCDVYRNDFAGGDSTFTVMFCAKFMNETVQANAAEVFKEDGNVQITYPVIKYHPLCEQFHSRLTLLR